MEKSLSFANIAFTGNPIFRDSEKQQDDCIALALQSPTTKVIILDKDFVLHKTDTPLLSLQEAQNFAPNWQKTVYLGHYNNHSILATFGTINPETVDKPLYASHLRQIYTQTTMASFWLGALAQAASLLNWHNNNSFCARCGEKTIMHAGGNHRKCSTCAIEHFPRVDPVAIMLVTFQDKCLLAYNHNFVEKRFSCLAGFIEQGETYEAAVRREVLEEVGLKTGEVTYIASQPWPFPQSLMLGSFVQSLKDEITIDDHEIAQAQWFTKDEVKTMALENHPQGFTIPPLGSIANYLIRHWLEDVGKKHSSTFIADSLIHHNKHK